MYTNIVFAGGGNRCFWQAGFWTEFSKEVELKPTAIASVSAGSAISSAILAGRIEETLAATVDVQAANSKNRYWSNALKGKNIHPHSELYRRIIHKALDHESLIKLQNAPSNRLLMAELPSWLGPRSAVLVGLMTYQLEKKLYQPVHPKWGRKVGFKSRFVEVNQCETVDALADLILCSSCTPPFTPIMRNRGDTVLDGGMVDNVPLHGVDTKKGKTLVLLSRPYKTLPKITNVDYAAPLQIVPVSGWDYTSPNDVIATFEQGKQDAQHYLKHFTL